MFGFLKSLFGGTSDPPTAAPTPEGFRRLPPPDSATEYAEVLGGILAAHDATALAQIRGALEHLPEEARQLHFGVHPDQDGEGTFDVMIHLDGPDLYVLNKAIAPYRKLFEIKRVPGGLNVAVPLFDPDAVDYEVRDVIADTAMDWVTRLWPKVGGVSPDLPVLAFCDEDWGNPAARWLQGAPE